MYNQHYIFIITGFTAFITSANEFGNNDENEIPYNLTELMQCSIKFDSIYHYLGLLSLNTTIWNLDIYIYLIEKLNFQVTSYDI